MPNYNKEVREINEKAFDAMLSRSGVKSLNPETFGKVFNASHYTPTQIQRLCSLPVSEIVMRVAMREHLPFRYDLAMHDNSKNSSVGHSFDANGTVGLKNIQGHIKDRVIPTIEGKRTVLGRKLNIEKPGELVGPYDKKFAENLSDNERIVSMLASAEYSRRLVEGTTAYYEQLSDFEKVAGKLTDKEGEIDTESSLYKSLATLGVNVPKFVDATKNIFIEEDPNVGNLKAGINVSKISIETATNSTLQSAKLEACQAESALLSNAIRAMVLGEEPTFTKDRISGNKELESLFLKGGENLDQFFSRIEGYAEEVKQVLGPASRDHQVLNKYMDACVINGSFGLSDTVERRASYTQATMEKGFTSEVEKFDVKSDVCFLTSKDGEIARVNPQWFQLVDKNIPDWLVNGNFTKDSIRDIERVVSVLFKANYKHEDEVARVILSELPNHFDFTELSEKDLKMGSRVFTANSHAMYMDDLFKANQRDMTIMNSGLPTFGKNPFYGLCHDLPYYKQCKQEAAQIFAKWGLFVDNKQPQQPKPQQPQQPQQNPQQPQQPQLPKQPQKPYGPEPYNGQDLAPFPGQEQKPYGPEPYNGQDLAPMPGSEDKDLQQGNPGSQQPEEENEESKLPVVPGGNGQDPEAPFPFKVIPGGKAPDEQKEDEDPTPEA